jgi:lysine-N-methylase
MGQVQEKALALSCPEAARVVLLDPQLLWTLRQRRADVEENGEVPAGFWQIRTVVLRVIANRTYPLWQRLFLLGVLCRRLDSMAQEESAQTLADFLAGFEATVASGALRESMQAMPADLEAQLDVVLRLAGLMLKRSNVRARFVEAVHAFTTGIGNGPGATLKSLTAHYQKAHARHFEPFMQRHPYILENYLANMIVRTQFPFGKEAMKPGATPDFAREFATLTAQFVLTRGLLIGTAGFHGDAFDIPHIVQSVQSAAKHFEHHPEFAKLAHALLVESRMDGVRGLAILLRNAEPAAASDAATPAIPEISAPAPRDERSASAADRKDKVLPA